MAASFKFNVREIQRLADDMKDPKLIRQIEAIPREKAVAALVAQGIAQNFTDGGPNWPALKFRQGQILKKTGLLFKSVTTPGAQGNVNRVTGSVLTWGTELKYAKIHNEGGIITAKNAKMLWIPISEKAARIGPLKNKADREKSGLKYGKDFIFKKSVKIPKREFLVLRQPAMQEISEHVLGRIIEVLQKYITKRSK